MPRLHDVVQVLQTYRGRYEALDAFVDDIDELRLPGAVTEVRLIAEAPRPVVEAWIGGERLSIELFGDQGIARFRLLAGAPQAPAADTVAIGAALGGALGAALGAATDKKEGLLGGLALGLLIGGLLGAAAAPVDRTLALQFDPVSSSWRLYDGPLRAWAKK